MPPPFAGKKYYNRTCKDKSNIKWRNIMSEVIIEGNVKEYVQITDSYDAVHTCPTNFYWDESNKVFDLEGWARDNQFFVAPKKAVYVEERLDDYLYEHGLI